MAQHNLDANFPPGTETHSRVRVASLRWGSAADAQALLDDCGRFSLVLGSDLIYHRAHHARLVATIDTLASDDATVLWASPDGGPDDPPTPVEGSSLPSRAWSFYEQMRRRGWDCVDISDSAALRELYAEAESHRPADLDSGGGRVRVARMTRQAQADDAQEDT